VYRRRVLRGVRFLNRVRPGWFREIDRDRLALDSEERDILGQLWGSYELGWSAIRAALAIQGPCSTADLGFTLYDHEQDLVKNPWPDIVGRFRELTDTWRSAIAVLCDADRKEV
jgi:hypothetical protein